MKFKVGDKVICTCEEKHSSDGIYRGHIYTVTKVYVTSISKVERIEFIDSAGEPNGWTSKNFELAVSSINEQKLLKKLGLS